MVMRQTGQEDLPGLFLGCWKAVLLAGYFPVRPCFHWDLQHSGCLIYAGMEPFVRQKSI